MNNKITDFKLTPLINPQYAISSLATYRQDGIQKSWEIVKTHDSVAILIYNASNKTFVLVKQFRPAVYVSNKIGMTIELCAGILDKKCSIKQTAKEEILEECGYQVDIDNLELITSFYTSVGFAGSRQSLFFTEVNNSQKVSNGGGIDGEQIEIIELSTSKINEFIHNQSIIKTPGLTFAFLWWQQNKA